MIRLMHTHGRSGGTLTNRLLGSMPDVVMMSEVMPYEPNAKGGGNDVRLVYGQAKRYYNITLKNREYIPSILELEDICERSGRHLVVREWTTMLYLRRYMWVRKWVNKKSRKTKNPGLYTLDHLPKHHVRPFAMVRESIDVYKSRVLLPGVHPLEKNLSYFSDWYLRYAQDVAASNMLIYYYESLCRDPIPYVKNMCRDLELPFSEKAVKTFYEYKNVLGSKLKSTQRDDITSIQQSRKRTYPYNQERLLRRNAQLRKSDKLLGVRREPFLLFIMRFLKDFRQGKISHEATEHLMGTDRLASQQGAP
ncbi:MAG: hypothetical protein GDA54_06535 [Alphaproteobacteria bacterium GM7ARS4]|nr:hypothetical protein [Alphaproteobacteria bacterium GM7ARS4]